MLSPGKKIKTKFTISTNKNICAVIVLFCFLIYAINRFLTFIPLKYCKYMVIGLIKKRIRKRI